MAKYIRQPSPYNTQIVALGVDTYLKMLLQDNFVVSTLPFHPSPVPLQGHQYYFPTRIYGHFTAAILGEEDAILGHM